MSAPAWATRYQLNTSTNEVGQTFTMEGYGFTGTGDTGTKPPPEAPATSLITSLGTLRMAQNTYNTTNNVFNNIPLHPFPADDLPQAGFPPDSAPVHDFDNGQAANDALGYFNGINNLSLGNAEGFPAQGDCGGPGLLGNSIASVASVLPWTYPTTPAGSTASSM